MVLDSQLKTNDKVYNILKEKLTKEYLDVTPGHAGLTISPLQPNYFSFTFSISLQNAENRKTIFIKIPKNDLRGQIPKIMPITEKDRMIAEEEIKSLKLLRKNWPTDNHGTEWIKLIGEIPEYNTIITEYVLGDEAFSIFRKYDIRGRFGYTNDKNILENSMGEIGKALRNYHNTESSKTTYYISDDLIKIEKYCNKLKEFSNVKILEKIVREMKLMNDFSDLSYAVPTIKGLDIRNILIGQKKNYFLLDPGKIKLAFREADLARFIITYRMIYWGSIKLLLFKTPSKNAELTFINGYSNEGISEKLLTILLIKEQLKHWLNIYDYINCVNWDSKLKKFVSLIYIDPFFSNIIDNDLKILIKSSDKLD